VCHKLILAAVISRLITQHAPVRYDRKMKGMVSAKLMAVSRRALLSVGRRTTLAQLAGLRSILSYLELGYWLHNEHQGSSPQHVATKFELFEIARQRITGQAPLYLEFGVYEGRSMRWWSQHLPQPEARLVGFDSFEGLPEDWRHDIRSGQFRTDGPPRIDDSRVSFQVGWFDDTLPQFTVPDHDQLIINIDSDLYSSAMTVLRWAEPYVCPGTLIYFDEFSERDHEKRAFSEWRAHSQYLFTPMGLAEGGTSWLFEVTSKRSVGSRKVA
jgi:hypothetical protein